MYVFLTLRMGLSNVLKDLVHTVQESKPEQEEPAEELTSKIDRFLLTVEDDKYHGSGWHPSTLCKFCPREKRLQEREKVPSETIEPQTRRVFDIGTDTHYRYQNYYLGPMGVLWGCWECSRCEKQVWGFFPEKKCTCKFWKKRWVYKEVPVKKQDKDLDEPYVGRSDGLLYLNKTWYVLDIKTSRYEGYVYIKKPYKAHIDQVNIYGKLINDGHIKSEEHKTVPVNKGIVLYYNKNDSSHKSYIFDLDFSRADFLLNQAKVYVAAKKAGMIPDRLEACRIKSNYRTKRCSMRDVCFQ